VSPERLKQFIQRAVRKKVNWARFLDIALLGLGRMLFKRLVERGLAGQHEICNFTMYGNDYE